MMQDELQRVLQNRKVCQIVGGISCGAVLFGGWLCWDKHDGTTELVLLSERTPTEALAAVIPTGKPQLQPERPGGKLNTSVQNPFVPVGHQPAPGSLPRTQGNNRPVRQVTQEIRLSGIIEAGEERLAMVSCEGGDLCLAEGETREGITLLELGDVYAVLSDRGETKTLHLMNATGGGQSREAKTEARPDKRRTSGHTNTVR